jgi:D-alanyl-D-alanine carboxypeptidase
MRNLIFAFTVLVPGPASAGSLQAALDAVQACNLFPGATAAVIRAGQSESAASGTTIDGARPLTTADRMATGSVGKTFVAALVLDMAAKGAIDLDTPISRYMRDEWFSRVPNAQGLTARMLLSHKGGLPDHVNDPRFAAVVMTDPDRVFTHEELVGFILDQAPLSAPGAKTHYSDTGYILLGLLIERVSGRSYDGVLQETVLTPLELDDTSMSTGRDMRGVVSGKAELMPALARFHPANEWTGGGLVSTSSDLARWAWLLYRGQALESPYLDTMLSGVEGGLPGFGLGVYIKETALGIAYGHGGWFPGYRSLIIYFPKIDTAVAIQADTDAEVDLSKYAVWFAAGGDPSHKGC